MTTFKYSGVSKDGTKVTGVIQAYDESGAVEAIRERCPVITDISEVQETKNVNISLGEFDPQDLAIISSQFSIILTTGMTLTRCVSMVARQTRKKDLKMILERTAEDINAGYSLADALEKEGPKFPPTFIETIRAGEQSGRLPACFARLSEYYERSGTVRSKLISALTYPVIVVCVGILVFILIMTKAVPMFTRAFTELEAELPMITKILIALSDFLVSDWWAILLIAALIILAVIFMKRSEAGRRSLAKFSLLRSPFHQVMQMNCSSQFANTMSIVLNAGLSVTKALEVTAYTVSNFLYSDAILQVKKDVEQGRSISQSMESNPCFDDTLTEMVGVGENAGTLPETLDVVGKYFTNEVDVSMTRLLNVLEPVLVLILSIGTIFLLLSVYLPMFTMYGSVQ